MPQTGRSHFTPELRSQNISHTTNTKFSFKTDYFLGARGLTASSYTVYDYTPSEHADL